MMFGHSLALTRKSAGLSLIQQAIGILRKYGTNAHVYLPGVGTVSGITAGNYLDSAGVTAATVDNPVGLSLDALQAMTLGAEKVTNGGFDADTDWTKGAGWTIGSGVASAAATAFVGVRQAKTFTTGKSYLVTYEVVSVTSGGCRPVFWGGAGVVGTDRTTAGTYSEILVALAASNELGISAAGAGFSGSVDNISVREIPGIHPTQATTANKCLLRLTSGKYNWVFDATDLLTATYPAGNESVTVIDSFLTGQVTTAGVNVVGAYSMGPSVTLYGRMIIKGSISASDLLVLQRFANSWAGL